MVAQHRSYKKTPLRRKYLGCLSCSNEHMLHHLEEALDSFCGLESDDLDLNITAVSRPPYSSNFEPGSMPVKLAFVRLAIGPRRRGCLQLEPPTFRLLLDNYRSY